MSGFPWLFINSPNMVQVISRVLVILRIDMLM